MQEGGEPSSDNFNLVMSQTNMNMVGVGSGLGLKQAGTL